MIDIKGFLKSFSYLIFPRRCFFCGCVTAPDIEVCSDCEKSVERIEAPVCPYCGRGKDRCSCQKHKNWYSAVTVPYYYNGAVRTCMHRFKFRGQEELSERLGGEMSYMARSVFKNTAADIVTCVPMREKNIKSRGYNQSELLAKKVADKLNLPFEELIIKLYDTENQRDMASYMRSGNVFGVFDVRCPEKVKDKTILLCDDILTSGATLNECAKMLVLSGAKSVLCVAAAAGFKKEKDEKNEVC